MRGRCRIVRVKFRLLLLTLLSSVLLPLALPNELLPQGSAALGPLCIAPFLAAVMLAPTHRFALLLGVVFGGLSTLFSNFWLMFFQSYTLWTLPMVVLAYVLFNAVLAPVLRGLSRILSATWRPFCVAVVWAVYEYLKSIGFLGFPWGLIAYPVHRVLPLIQFADITGVWGISFLMALVNAVLAEGIVRYVQAYRFPPVRTVSWLNQMAVVVCLVVVATVYGLVRLATPPPSEKQVRLLLVQQNTDTWSDGGFARQGLLTCQRLSVEGLAAADAKPDLIVWSETSIGGDVAKNRAVFERWPAEEPLLPFVRGLGAYLLSGSQIEVSRERFEFMNGVVLLAPDSTVVESYGKQHPVPFAEAIPFWEYDVVKRFFREVVQIWTPWVMGDRYTIFKLPLADGSELRFGGPICFEDTFSDLCRQFVLAGAEMWINLTNDYWSKTVTAEVQHFVAAKFRAIENRRALVRSTNGGVTAVVDASGKVLASLPLFRPDYLNVVVPVQVTARLTPYTIFGDYFPKTLAVVVLLIVGWHAVWTFKRRRQAVRPGRLARVFYRRSSSS